MNEVKVDDIFLLSSGKYITLDEIILENERYIFVNKLDDNEEPTKDFRVFKSTKQGLIEEKNKEKLRPLLEYFSNKANEKLELIADLYKKGAEDK